MAGTSVLAFVGAFLGGAGRARFMRLSEQRARGVHDGFCSRLIPWSAGGAAAVSLVEGVSSYWLGHRLAGLAALTGGLCFVTALFLFPRAKVTVLDAFEQRELEPLQPRETSARGSRRQKQFAVVLLGAYLGQTLLNVVAVRMDADWPRMLALPLIVLILVAGIGLLWSLAWRYGDERPA